MIVELVSPEKREKRTDELIKEWKENIDLPIGLNSFTVLMSSKSAGEIAVFRVGKKVIVSFVCQGRGSITYLGGFLNTFRQFCRFLKRDFRVIFTIRFNYRQYKSIELFRADSEFSDLIQIGL